MEGVAEDLIGGGQERLTGRRTTKRHRPLITVAIIIVAAEEITIGGGLMADLMKINAVIQLLQMIKPEHQVKSSCVRTLPQTLHQWMILAPH